MSVSMTRTKTPKGGHSGPLKSVLEKSAAVRGGVQTELGCLPADWRVDRFDSVFDVQQGRQVSKGNRVGDNQRPFLRTKNVFWNRLDLADLDEMHFSEADESRLALKPDDLLICEGGDIGRTAIWGGLISRCYYQNHLHRARIRDPNTADAQFVLFWLWYAFEFGHLYFGRGNVTTIPNLSQSKLRELPVAIPTLAEQRKIAAVLGLVQRAMEQQERLIALTTELKKTLLHQLFTHGLRGEPQKQTEIGLVPESWEVVRLGEFCALGTGTTPSTARPDYYNGDVPFVKTTHIVNNRIKKSETHVSKQAVNDCSLKLYSPGTVLMAMYGQGKTRCQVALLDISAATSQNAAAIQPSEEINSEFLWQYLMSRYQVLRNSGALGHISHLNLGYVRDFQIPKPPVVVQCEIAEILGTIDRRLMLIESKRYLFYDLFRTLLRQLMTAEIRVNDLDLPDMEANP